MPLISKLDGMPRVTLELQCYRLLSVASIKLTDVPLGFYSTTLSQITLPDDTARLWTVSVHHGIGLLF